MRPVRKTGGVIADTAAKALDDDHIAESVFELAITMAHSDLVFHEREKDVLDVLAQSLGIEPSRAQADQRHRCSGLGLHQTR